MSVRRTIIAMAVAGLVAGAGGGAATSLWLSPAPEPRAPIKAGDGQFVTLGALLIPLMMGDGRFTGYVRVEAQLEVGAADVEGVTARLPLVIHAVNLRAFGKPLAAGPDGRLPDAAAIRALVSAEASTILGTGVVRSVAVTGIAPA